MIPPIAVMDQPLDAAALRLEAQDPRAGAIVVFEGCARDHHEDRAVESLAYEAFVPMAVAELEKLRTEAMERFALLRCLIHHRKLTPRANLLRNSKVLDEENNKHIKRPQTLKGQYSRTHTSTSKPKHSQIAHLQNLPRSSKVEKTMRYGQKTTT